jgi:hypothetical protein
VIDQLDKKRKVVMDQQAKGEKLTQDPKAPKFLTSYIDRLKALWVDANKQAENRLAALKGSSFVKYITCFLIDANPASR